MKKVFLCGDSPNCVSTLESRPAFKIESIALKNTLDVKKLVESVLKQMKAKQITHEDHTWNCVFESEFFKFKDVMAISYDLVEQQLNFSSKSLKGFYDFKANLKRLKRFRSDIQKLIQI